MTTDDSPLSKVLDFALYAPIGLAVEAREVLPKLAEAGRKQVGRQLTAAQALGKLAVDHGSRQAGDVMRRAASQAEGLLVRVGIVPAAPATDVDDLPPRRPRRATTPDLVPAAPPATGETAPAPPPPPSEAPPLPAAEPVAADGGTAELAIPGYDTLSASQVVQRLAGLSDADLAAVAAYEQTGRSRKTILFKVAQLRTGA